MRCGGSATAQAQKTNCYAQTTADAAPTSVTNYGPSYAIARAKARRRTWVFPEDGAAGSYYDA